MLQGKKVLFGVTSSIACYKAAGITRTLVNSGAEVQVIMTQNATRLISPMLFEHLTRKRCLTDTFAPSPEMKVEHIAAAQWADVFITAPATANIIAKYANGIADDMLSTTALACRCPRLVAPSMNTAMYENPVTQRNLDRLRDYGYQIIEPAVGLLACGDTGRGKLAEEAEIIEAIEQAVTEKDMYGQRVLISAGPTQESIDPVRFITNHSSGKMGYALARAAARRGATVTLVSGPCSLDKPFGVEVVDVKSAAQMREEIMVRADVCDIIVMAAAVADYRPAYVADQKIKKDDGGLNIALERTSDILAELGAGRRRGQFLCGFAMETENLLENARAKLAKKNIDMIAANSIRVAGAGFGVDTNVITLITAREEAQLPLMSKDDAANEIFDHIMNMKLGY
jgi:phosphopantothenoylcysteine decarboxylase/phosphopantothenate--cysteine ligase